MVVSVIALLGAACAATPPPTASPTRAPNGPPPAPGASASIPDASSAPRTFADLLADQRESLDACYATARAANTRLGRTTIAFAFAIDELGKPTTVDLQYRNRMEDTAKECLRDAALALTFPSSMQGRQAASLTFIPAP
jgi:hypothetical protein